MRGPFIWRAHQATVPAFTDHPHSCRGGLARRVRDVHPGRLLPGSVGRPGHSLDPIGLRDTIDESVTTLGHALMCSYTALNVPCRVSSRRRAGPVCGSVRGAEWRGRRRAMPVVGSDSGRPAGVGDSVCCGHRMLQVSRAVKVRCVSCRQLDCPGSVELTDDEMAQLDSVPHPAHEVVRRNWCELEPGHSGWHAGVGQDDDDGHAVITWWIWWTDSGDRKIVTCAPRPGQLDEDTCLLPAGHAGQHSF